MPDEIIKFDPETQKLVRNLDRLIQQTEEQLRLLCRVYLNAKGEDSLKNDFELLPDNSGLIKIKDKKSNGK